MAIFILSRSFFKFYLKETFDKATGIWQSKRYK